MHIHNLHNMTFASNLFYKGFNMTFRKYNQFDLWPMNFMKTSVSCTLKAGYRNI